jgi:AraC-like DNA-binding protein
MDVLSDVLGTLRLQSTVFASAELAPPWGIQAGPREHFAFHIVPRGHCWLEVDDGRAPVQVNAGDVVVLARGHGHTLRDSLASPARPIEELLAAGAFGPASYGGATLRARGGTTQIVCGCFRFDDLRGDLLLSALPTVIHTHEMASDVGPWLAHTVRLLAYESSGERPGAETVVSRLCDALFVYVIRAVLAGLQDDDASWLRALVAPQVGKALRLIHESPGEPWSVARLAARVGMSRSAFAERFARVVGESPMQYVMRWRLRKAATLLRAGDTGIAEVAARVGYESEAAFGKAFKRAMGVAPGAYRRSSRGSVAA